MSRLSHTTKLVTTLVMLAAAIAVGLAVGLVGGSAASSALDGRAGGGSLPSAARLHAAAAALARTTVHATLVAQARTSTVALYHRPGTAAYTRIGPLADSYGTAPVFRVLATRGAWLHVSLPIRPDHSTAWVRRADVRVGSTDYRLEVQLAAHRLVVHEGARTVLRAPIAVGKALTPTPGGTYFIAYALRTADPNGFFGPYAFGLSAYSHVFTSFAGGDGEIGLHGTSEPWLLGRSVSHGCIRIRNSVITRLVHLLPLGTPVVIER